MLIILLGVLLTNVTKYFKLSKRKKVKIRKTIRIVVRAGQPYQNLSHL